MMNGVVSAGMDTQIAHKNSRHVDARVGRIVAQLGVDVHRYHLGAGDQQSGQYAGEIQRADRGRDQPAPDDHEDRRRDDDRKHRRHRRDGDREGKVVAFLNLRIDEDLALARRIGGRGAGDAGKEYRQQDVDLGKRARPMTDHGARQLHQTVGDAADAHQVGRQQEKRHCQQDE